jgi:hypothetical protein
MLVQADRNLVDAADDGAPTRRYRRWHVEIEASVTAGGARRKCMVYDVSPSGARVTLGEGSLPVGARLDFELPGYGPIPSELCYDRDGYQGLMFLHDEAEEVEVARHLVGVEQNGRGAQRHSVDIDALLLAGGIETDCLVVNVSRTGAGLIAAEARHLNPGQQVSLYVLGAGFIGGVVQRVHAEEIGVVFLEPLAEEPVAPAISPTWLRGARLEMTLPSFTARNSTMPSSMLTLSRIAVPEIADPHRSRRLAA